MLIPKAVTGRFIPKHWEAMCRGGTGLGAVHCHTGIGASGQANLDLMGEVATVLNAWAGPWILGGDFNCTPAELQKTGWLELVDGVVHAPTAATSCSRTIDFFVVAKSCSHAVKGVHVVEDTNCFPHKAVRLLVSSCTRQDVVRELRKVPKFEARQPYGPMKRQHFEASPESPLLLDDPRGAMAAAWSSYGGIINELEDQLCDLNGCDSKERARHDRALGPSHVLKPVQRDVGRDGHRTNPITRAWRLDSRWLKTMASSKDSSARRRALWKLLHYEHQLEVSDPALGDAKVEFQRWHEELKFEHFRDKNAAAELAAFAEGTAAREEAAASTRSVLNHRRWLQEGAAKGLGRQHKMSRTATGWIPSRIGRDTEVDEENDEAWEDASITQQAATPTHQVEGSAKSPMGSQREVDEQRQAWGVQWDTGQPRRQPNWPTTVLSQIPDLTVSMLTAACMTFPSGTGLGWDAIHPRALTRLPRRLLMQIILCLMAAEVTGEWPQLVGWVVIVLLPKPDGGRRPIGLLPCLPKIWSRTRRSIAAEWEKRNSRDFLYGGAGKGSEVAAWRQAARAELAALDHKSYAQGLLDLVKAYERIPHWVLLREAERHGYPVWLLRLAVAAYRLLRVIRIDQVVSLVILAERGITAGSGSATTEMRLLMLDVVDAAYKVFPQVSPCVYVDDIMAAALADSDEEVKSALTNFLRSICSRLTADGLEISASKSVVTASSQSLGEDIAANLSQFGIRFTKRVKALGIGLAAGNRRNAKVLRDRLNQFRKRLPRFQRLKQAGVDTANLLRTGGIAAMAHGEFAT